MTAPSLIKPQNRGMSLLELMVSMSILAAIFVLIASVLDTTSKGWMRTTDRATQFRDSRLAFEYLTRNLQQATLNTYWDYHYDSTKSNAPQEEGETPSRYAPQSELHFLTGQAAELLEDEERYRTHAVFFQAPLGKADRYMDLSNLLNARGYFIEFGSDVEGRPDFLDGVVEPKYRYRLMEFRPPAEQNQVYADAQDDLGNQRGSPPPWFPPQSPAVVLDDWYLPDSKLYTEKMAYHETVRPVAENVIALIVSPRRSDEESGRIDESPEGIAPKYAFNSREDFAEGVSPTEGRETRNLLPPLLKVVLVTITDTSAIQLQARYGERPPPELELSPGWFTKALRLEEDLLQFEEQLREANVEYRIFRSTLRLQAAKWTHN